MDIKTKSAPGFPFHILSNSTSLLINLLVSSSPIYLGLPRLHPLKLLSCSNHLVLPLVIIKLAALFILLFGSEYVSICCVLHSLITALPPMGPLILLTGLLCHVCYLTYWFAFVFGFSSWPFPLHSLPLL